MSHDANVQAVLDRARNVAAQNQIKSTNTMVPPWEGGLSYVEQIDAKMKDMSDRMQRVTDAFMNLMHDGNKPTKPPKVPCLPEATLEAVAERLKSAEKVIVMVGAGISTAAGIPDFRTPGEGLYDNLQKYNLPTPQSIFNMEYFESNPEPFFTLAKELYPVDIKPTISHCFLKLLHNKGVLKRVFSQNIDMLELSTGLPEDKVMEAHGSFKTGTCIECGAKYDTAWVKESIFSDGIPRCEDSKYANEDVKCEGVVKPDIVFFGERLPNEYHCKSSVDFPACDLLIVLGTSLSVAPFNRLAEDVPKTCPRLLINRNKVCTNYMEASTTGSPLFYFDIEGNTRDVFCSSDCDYGVEMLASLAGWGTDLESIVKQYTDREIRCKLYIRPNVQPEMRSSYVDEGKKKKLDQISEDIEEIAEEGEEEVDIGDFVEKSLMNDKPRKKTLKAKDSGKKTAMKEQLDAATKPEAKPVTSEPNSVPASISKTGSPNPSPKPAPNSPKPKPGAASGKSTARTSGSTKTRRGNVPKKVVV